MSELVCRTLELLSETKGAFASAVKNIFDTKTMATLKISELSVGDWVRCGEDTNPYKIIGIDSKVHPNVTLCDSYYPQGVI